MGDLIQLKVGGFDFEGFKSIKVTRSIESIAGQFALEVSDRWNGDDAPWTILEEDECQVLLNGRVVIDGYIDKRNPAMSENSRSLSYTGRDRAAALVDNYVLLSKWTHYGVRFADFATKLAEPFGVKVSMQAGLVIPPIAKVSITPGDKVHEVLARLASDLGVLLVSDGAGGVVITRTGTSRATPLIEGENLKAASIDYDSTDRYHRYVMAAQPAATDEASGDVTRVMAEAIDLGVRRTERVMLMVPDKGYNQADAKRRVDWEARIRAAKAETVNAGVQGWLQPDGTIWPLNALTRVQSPGVGVDGDLVISQIDHTVDDKGGSLTQFRLLRPDAFTPEPKATVKSSVKTGASGFKGWPELKNGGR